MILYQYFWYINHCNHHYYKLLSAVKLLELIEVIFFYILFRKILLTPILKFSSGGWLYHLSILSVLFPFLLPISLCFSFRTGRNCIFHCLGKLLTLTPAEKCARRRKYCSGHKIHADKVKKKKAIARRKEKAGINICASGVNWKEKCLPFSSFPKSFSLALLPIPQSYAESDYNFSSKRPSNHNWL